MISKGNHVKFTHFVLLAVSEEAKTGLPGLLCSTFTVVTIFILLLLFFFFFVQCIIKQLFDLVFVISRIIKV